MLIQYSLTLILINQWAIEDGMTTQAWPKTRQYPWPGSLLHGDAGAGELEKAPIP
jgi:hypothetical protein